MRNTLVNGIGWILILISATFSYLLFVENYFPYDGIACALAILASLVFVIKQNKMAFDAFMFAVILILSFFIVSRANPLLVFLDIVTLLFFGAWLSLYHFDSALFQPIRTLIAAPILFLVRSIISPNLVTFSRQIKLGSLTISASKIKELVISVCVSLGVLIVVIPLLASANPFFNQWVETVLSALSLDRLVEWIQSILGDLFIVQVISFIIFSLFLPRMVSMVSSLVPLDKPSAEKEPAWPLFLPKLVLSLLLLIFFASQIQLYFSTSETLQILGYTHSQYAREVFAQLSIVAGVIVVLLYNDRSYKARSQILTYVLVLEGLFLTIMALKSVIDYSQMWGFTYKRLWGYAVVFWIFVVLSSYGYAFWRRISHYQWIKSMIVFSVGVLITINIVNFDDIMFRYHKASTSDGVDYQYLAQLSSDAHAYDELINLIGSELNQSNLSDARRFALLNAGTEVLNKINYLKDKYDSYDWRTLNISEYYQYQQVKDLDTTGFEQTLEKNAVVFK
ncbi:DUF4173 domain-containing protein [candidate division WWE3 bacterium]|nr:DUF4173 domain-containing protein [candidate division WWE3 bacterium]